jgi:phosphoserine phosphatase
MSYKLICFDMDGVLFKDSNFWIELHKKFGTWEEGKKLTEKYLYNDYEKLVQEVVHKLWKGKDAKPYYELVDSFEYMPGVDEVFKFLKEKGFMTAIISTSSIDVARRVQKEFCVDHIYANELIIRDGVVAGEFVWPMGAGNQKRVEIIKSLCDDLGISSSECIYVGDSESDVEACGVVGKSIAFNSSSEELKEVATHVVESSNLSDILTHLQD